MVVEEREVGSCLRHLLNVQNQVFWTGREKQWTSELAQEEERCLIAQSHVTANCESWRHESLGMRLRTFHNIRLTKKTIPTNIQIKRLSL